MVLINTWARSRADTVEQDLLVAYPVIDICGHNRQVVWSVKQEMLHWLLVRIKLTLLMLKLFLSKTPGGKEF